MRGKFMTAAIALILICSLAGCNKSTASTYNRGIEDNTHSAINRNGVNDGTDVVVRDSNGNVIVDTPNWNDKLDNWKGMTGINQNGTTGVRGR